VAQRELADGSLCALPLGRRKLERSWGILLRRGQRLSLAQETFIGLCAAVSENLQLEFEPGTVRGAAATGSGGAPPCLDMADPACAASVREAGPK
jgi:hypothetical protein